MNHNFKKNRKSKNKLRLAHYGSEVIHSKKDRIYYLSRGKVKNSRFPGALAEG
jgi:hypothetical protein